MIDARAYQAATIELLDAAIAAGSRSPLLVLPTGSGKTIVAAALIKRAVESGKRSLFLAPRRELVMQASRQLAGLGVGHGVILAGADAQGGLYSAVQVGSIDTLLSRTMRTQRLTLVDPDLVICDEAHLSITAIRQRLLNQWPNAVRIGLTATPTRKDGAALGALYDRLIEPVTVRDLVRDGYLVPGRYFSVSEPDLSRIRTVAGDFHQGELEEAMDRPQLVGDVVGHWLQHAAARRTVVFATSVKHSVALCEEFLRSGVAAEHVDAGTVQELRDATFDRFRGGRTQVLTNCFLASYGFDLPDLSCVVLARPTRSLMLFLQMIGRGLRPAPGKVDCLILDHSGSVHRHGFAHDERVWTLDGDQALIERSRTARERAQTEVRICPECHAAFSGPRLCPECGYSFVPRGRAITTLDGQLIEVGAELPKPDQDAFTWLCELRGLAIERGYKPGWAAYKFKEKFGDWPRRSWERAPAAMPSTETRRWVRAQQIRWLKSRPAQRHEVQQ